MATFCRAPRDSSCAKVLRRSRSRIAASSPRRAPDSPRPRTHGRPERDARRRSRSRTAPDRRAHRPTPFLAFSGSVRTSYPATSITPLVGRMIPAMARIVVVLPCPVGPDESEDSTGRHVERQPAHGGNVAVNLMQVTNTDHLAVTGNNRGWRLGGRRALGDGWPVWGCRARPPRPVGLPMVIVSSRPLGFPNRTRNSGRTPRVRRLQSAPRGGGLQSAARARSGD
jgi:hypothetical protein